MFARLYLANYGGQPYIDGICQEKVILGFGKNCYNSVQQFMWFSVYDGPKYGNIAFLYDQLVIDVVKQTRGCNHRLIALNRRM